MNIDDFFPNKVNPLKINQNELKIFKKKFKDNKSLNLLLSLEDLLYKVFPYMNEEERKHKLFYGLLLSENHLILRQVINLLTKKEIQELNILRNDIIKIGNPKICLNQISCEDKGEFQKYHYILKDNLKAASTDVKILPLGEIIMEKGKIDDNKEDFLDYTLSKKKINLNNDQQNPIYYKKIITNIFMSICEDMKLCINCKIKLIRDFNFYLSKLYNYNNLNYKITVKNIASIVEFQPLHAWKNTKFVKGLGNQEIKSKVNIKFLLERMCKNLTLIKTENPRKTVIEALIYEDINNLKIMINDEIEFIKEKDINLIKRQIENILAKFNIKDIDIDSLVKPYSLTSIIEKHFKPIHIQIKNLDFLGEADLAKDKQFINQLELLFKDNVVVTKISPPEKIKSKSVKTHEPLVKSTILKRKYHENIKNKLNLLDKHYLSFHDKCELFCGSENWFRIRSGLTIIIITYLYFKITQIIWTDEPLYEEIIKNMEFNKDLKNINNLSNNTNVPKIFKRNYHQSLKKENKDEGFDSSFLSNLLKSIKERDESIDLDTEIEKLNEKELDFILEQYKASSLILLSNFEKIEKSTKTDLRKLDEFIAEKEKIITTFYRLLNQKDKFGVLIEKEGEWAIKSENSIKSIDLALIEKNKLIKNFEAAQNIKDYHFNMYTKLESVKREKLIRIFKRDYYVNYKLQHLHDNRSSFEAAFLHKNVLKTPKVDTEKIYTFGKKSTKYIAEQAPIIIDNVGRAGELIYTNSPEIINPSKKIGGYVWKTTKKLANSSLNTTADIANNMTETTSDLAYKFYKTGFDPAKTVNQQVITPKIKFNKKQLAQVEKFEAETLANIEKTMQEKENNTLNLNKFNQEVKILENESSSLFKILFDMYNKNIFNVLIFYIKIAFLFIYNNIRYYLTYMRMCFMRRYAIVTYPPIFNIIYDYYIKFYLEIVNFFNTLLNLIVNFWNILESLGLIWKLIIFTAVLTFIYFCFTKIINFILLPFKLIWRLYKFLYSYKNLAAQGREVEIKNDLIVKNLIVKEKEKRSLLNKIFKRNYHVNYKLQNPKKGFKGFPNILKDILKQQDELNKNLPPSSSRLPSPPPTPRNFTGKPSSVNPGFFGRFFKPIGNFFSNNIDNRSYTSIVKSSLYLLTPSGFKSIVKAFVWSNLGVLAKSTRDATLGLGVGWAIKKGIGFMVFSVGVIGSSYVPFLAPVFNIFTTGFGGKALTAVGTELVCQNTNIFGLLFKSAQDSEILKISPSTAESVVNTITTGITGSGGTDLVTVANNITNYIAGANSETSLANITPTAPPPIIEKNSSFDKVILPISNLPDLTNEPITNIKNSHPIENIIDKQKSEVSFFKQMTAGMFTGLILAGSCIVLQDNKEFQDFFKEVSCYIGSFIKENTSELKDKVSNWFFDENTFLSGNKVFEQTESSIKTDGVNAETAVLRTKLSFFEKIYAWIFGGPDYVIENGTSTPDMRPSVSQEDIDTALKLQQEQSLSSTSDDSLSLSEENILKSQEYFENAGSKNSSAETESSINKIDPITNTTEQQFSGPQKWKKAFLSLFSNNNSTVNNFTEDKNSFQNYNANDSQNQGPITTVRTKGIFWYATFKENPHLEPIKPVSAVETEINTVIPIDVAEPELLKNINVDEEVLNIILIEEEQNLINFENVLPEKKHFQTQMAQLFNENNAKAKSILEQNKKIEIQMPSPPPSDSLVALNLNSDQDIIFSKNKGLYESFDPDSNYSLDKDFLERKIMDEEPNLAERFYRGEDVTEEICKPYIPANKIYESENSESSGYCGEDEFSTNQSQSYYSETETEIIAPIQAVDININKSDKWKNCGDFYESGDDYNAFEFWKFYEN